MLLALTASAFAWAADGSPEPRFRFYSVADGLAQSEIFDIEQDGAGFLWLTSGRGLYRFDGERFTNVSVASGMAATRVTALEVAADDTVWVGSSGGEIVTLRNGEIQSRIQSRLEQPGTIIDIETFDDQALAVIEGVGLLHIRESDGIKSGDLVPGDWSSATNIVETDGRLWFLAAGGLHTIELQPQANVRLVASDIHIVHAGAGGIWAIDGARRLGRITDDGFVPAATVPVDEPVISLASQANGRVWLATSHNLFSLDVSSPHTDTGNVPVRRYGSFEELTTIHADREGTLWLSSGTVLGRFLSERFLHYKLQMGAEPQTVWGITQDADGRFWFATQKNLLLRESDESLIVVGSDFGLPEAAVRDVVRSDARKTIWAAVTGHGLYRIDTAAMSAAQVPGTADMDILDVEVTGPNAVWIATAESGIGRYDASTGRLQIHPSPEGQPVYTIAGAPDGSVWVGIDNVGLARLVPDGSGGYSLESSEIASNAGPVLFAQVRVSDSGGAWVASEDGGAFSYDGERFNRIAGVAADFNKTAYIVEPLPDGTLVVGGEKGLNHLRPGEAGSVFYNENSGFLGLESNAHATYLDEDGGLWIGTVDGVTRMDTSIPMFVESTPTPRIDRIAVLGSNAPLDDGNELPLGESGIAIDFAAVSLLHPHGVEVSYRLKGIDSGWSEPTTDRRVQYTRLPPGSHEFELRARVPGGEWGESVSAATFTVPPKLWQRSSFIIAAIVFALVIIRGAMVYRTRQIEHVNRTLMEQVSERTRSIEEARLNLQLSNERLSREMRERRKADRARVEVEERFRQAFENAPIGMGLMDAESRLFDANPALMQMLWGSSNASQPCRFVDAIVEADRERFEIRYAELIEGRRKQLDDRYECQSLSGNLLQTEMNVSAVNRENGEFLYAVIQVQDITESMRLTSKLQQQAKYDELTGLFNRREFESELDRAWAFSEDKREHSFLLYMDLDQFKVVNDTSGHAAGDKLLQSISEILLSQVRTNDTVGRMGGDEFAIILWKCPESVAARIAESIRSAIEGFRFQWDNENYKVGISIGCVPLDSRLGDIDEILQLADSACFAAKEEGRNRVHILSDEKDSARAHRRQIRWVQRIREAMDKNLFAIYAQRIAPLTEGLDEAPRYEVLLRLRDPQTRKLVPPGAFLPATERYGLSLELDEWVVRNLINALYVYQSFDAEHRRYWINLSGLSVGEKRFASFLRTAIEQSPLPPGTLNFEITETAVIRNVAEAGQLISELREMGCEFALDDFGSGLSSFGYLRRLPVSCLKIDGMFVRNILHDETDRIFVKSIIDIARTLDIKTVCEFIEDELMLEVVRDLGADYAQGFAIERPFELAPGFPGRRADDHDAAEPQAQAG